jgi:hypothetical protein
MDHIVNRYSRTVNWQKELNESHCKPILQSAKLTERAAWITHSALSVSLSFWSIGLQCDPCSSFCQFTVLEYLFTMWSKPLFLSVYRSGVSVFNVIHAALSVNLPFQSICLQWDPYCPFCQFTVLEYRFTMWSMLLFLLVYRSGVSVCNDPYCSFCHFTVLEYQLTMWSMLLFLSAYRSGVSYFVIRYSRTVSWQKEQHESHCKPILQNGKLTERAAQITL